MHIALVTCEMFPKLQDSEKHLMEALEKLDVKATPAVWNSSSIDWKNFDACLIRNTWDYYKRPEEFFAWLSSLEQKGVPVWNGSKTLKWNANKKYLFELSTLGIPVVPSLPPPLQWSENDFNRIQQYFMCKELVIKPLTSAGAHRTYRCSSWQEFLQKSEADGGPGLDLFAQPFLGFVQTHGESSLLFFGKSFSHAWHKLPKPGDYRVQSMYGGQYQIIEPDNKEIDICLKIFEYLDLKLDVWGEKLYYARFDFLRTPNGPLLSELELIEPDFALEYVPEASERLAFFLKSCMEDLSNQK